MRNFNDVPKKQGHNGPTTDYEEWNRQTWGDAPLDIYASTVTDTRDTRDPVELGERIQGVRKIWPDLKLSEVQDRSNNFADWPDGPEAFQQTTQD